MRLERERDRIERKRLWRGLIFALGFTAIIGACIAWIILILYGR
jgi:hypothetical protein